MDPSAESVQAAPHTGLLANVTITGDASAAFASLRRDGSGTGPP
jgi:hypothetical protein